MSSQRMIYVPSDMTRRRKHGWSSNPWNWLSTFIDEKYNEYLICIPSLSLSPFSFASGIEASQQCIDLSWVTVVTDSRY